MKHGKLNTRLNEARHIEGLLYELVRFYQETSTFRYLLQAFTESLFDKDGLFIEVIERRGCRGFGAGNIKALFSALQKDKTGEECAASSL